MRNDGSPHGTERRSRFGFTDWDVADRPQVVIWEATRACALACRHCRARAQRRPGPDELSTSEARALLETIAAMAPAIFVITGGDPLRRSDLFDLLACARTLGLRVSLAPSVTPDLDGAAMRRMADGGCVGVQFSLDGADAAAHDRFRGQPGTFARTLEACRWAHEVGIPLTIATTVTRQNAERLPVLRGLVESLGVVRWSLFFLVPTGRARPEEMVSADQAEAILVWAKAASETSPFVIKTTEAPQIRRLLGEPDGRQGAATIADGRGFVFVAANGDICPSGFLPLAAGNVRGDDLLEIYRHAPLFRSLRDPDALRGPRCGRCRYRSVCGGSRSRAYAVFGDPLADDPLCAYDPQAAPIPPTEEGGPC